MSSTPKTGNDFVDEFLANYDFRMSDADTKTPESSKANLRKMRPAVFLLAQNDTVKCEQFIRQWISKNVVMRS